MPFDPTAWERRIALPDGRAVLIRPLRPEDEALYPPFLAAVTPDDMRLRMFAPIRELSRRLIFRLTHIDYATAMAFIALDGATGEMLGVARLHDAADGVTGEYAILVRSDLKGHGLGWQLMQLVIAYARAKGLRTIEGQVLRENTTMLAMCQQLGFAIDRDPDAAYIARVRLAL